MTLSTIGGGTTFSGTGCPIPRGAATEDEEPRQSASRRLRVEDMDACDIEQSRRRGDGVLEGVGSVGGEAEVGLSAPSAESRVSFVYFMSWLLDTWQAEVA